MPLIDMTTREGWENIPSLQERVMLRLLLRIDRRGRYDGRLPQLLIALWPLGDGPGTEAFRDAMQGLSDRGLLRIYHVDNQPYVLVHGTVGDGASRWPGPPEDGQVSYEPNPADPEVARLPLTSKQEFVVLESHIAEWQLAYPAVDILLQLRRMAIWCKDNPTRVKTRKGIGRFIHTWLGRQQDETAGRTQFRPPTNTRSLAVRGLYGDS